MILLDNSDHNVLLWSIQCCNQPSKEKTQLCYNQADYNSMREFVRERVTQIDSKTESTSSMWNSFNGVMQEAIDKFIPIGKPLHITVKNHYGYQEKF